MIKINSFNSEIAFKPLIIQRGSVAGSYPGTGSGDDEGVGGGITVVGASDSGL